MILMGNKWNIKWKRHQTKSNADSFDCNVTLLENNGNNGIANHPNEYHQEIWEAVTQFIFN